jgi:hypothetical protein
MALTRQERNKKSYEYVKKWRRKVKETLVAEAGGKCIRCGYSKSMRALQFHHRDPTTKEFNLRSSIKALDRLRAEAAKCDLLCSNCHAEVHEEIDGD